MPIVYLGLGSNLGDRRAHIESALKRLDGVPNVAVQRVSELIETEPVGGSQGLFLNGVCRISCGLTPHALLAVLKALEAEAGRDAAAPRNADRPLDLDILLFGEEEIDTRDLVVPHPRLWERDFVTRPLAELGVDVGKLPPPERPRLLRDVAAFQDLNTRWLQGSCTTGLVPTMGALHEGHASLLRKARQECDRVAATIFVNPLQFAPTEDLADYPRTLEADLQVLREEGVDAVFVPAEGAIYPKGFASHVRVGAEAQGLEGATRPTHFEGVATVVCKLFALARPTLAYFGRKDAQQLAVIRRMVKDLGFPIRIRECATVREADGLALSSRNAYLSQEDRAAAVILSRSLCAIRELHESGEHDPQKLLDCGRSLMATEPRCQLDYLELRQEDTLEVLPTGPARRGRVLVAASFGGTRLIDNMSLVRSDEPD